MVACIGQVGVDVRHFHAVTAGLGSHQALAQFSQACIAFQYKLCRRLVGLGHVLRHLPHPPVARHVKVAAIFVQGAVEQGKQGGLARTVAPDQPDLFSGIEGDRGLVKQHFGAAAKGDVFKVDHEKCVWGRSVTAMKMLLNCLRSEAAATAIKVLHG